MMTGQRRYTLPILCLAPRNRLREQWMYNKYQQTLTIQDDSAYKNETAIDSVAALDDAVKGAARWISKTK